MPTEKVEPGPVTCTPFMVSCRYLILICKTVFLFIPLPVYNKTMYINDLNSEVRLQQA